MPDLMQRKVPTLQPETENKKQLHNNYVSNLTLYVHTNISVVCTLEDRGMLFSTLGGVGESIWEVIDSGAYGLVCASG